MSPREIIPATAVLPVHMAQALTGESPFWDSARGVLWWIDIQGQRLLGFAPTTGERTEHRLPLMPGFVVGRTGGGLALGLEDGIYAFDPTSGVGDRLVSVEDDKPGNRLNDGKPDGRGRLWFGTMDKTGNGAPVGALYRFAPDRELHTERQEVRIPNAIAYMPDGSAMLFSDSRTATVEIADYDLTTGERGRSRPFVQYGNGEHPDGVCVDAEGGVWIAVVGGSRIERRLPDGSLDLIVDLPISRPTMPMLGGSDGRTLFVTSQRRFLPTAALAGEPLSGNLLAVRTNFQMGPAYLAEM
jgi:sugar lactone lactonase YvrE